MVIMKPVEKSVALKLLGNNLDLIHNCVRSGWADFLKKFSASQRMVMSTRSRRCLVNDLIVLRARAVFEGNVEAVCMDIQGMFVVAFESGVAVRFKKLDDSFKASGIPTTQSLDFMRQEGLPGVGDGIHLHAGYRLDRFEAELEGVYLACPRSRTANHWWHELKEGEISATGETVVLPFDPSGPVSPEERPFKIVRRGGEEKDAADKQ